MTPIAWIGVIALTIASSVSAEAASLESKELVAKLVSEHKVAARGRTTTVMVHQKMAPGWHTYWRNPGDSGQAPTIQWDLPEGVTVTPAAWPAPRRIAYGPLVNYGYKDESALSTTAFTARVS